MKKSDRTIVVGKDISILSFLKTRFVTPKEILNGIKSPCYDNISLGRILFNARYNAHKAIEGYDFIIAKQE